MRLSSEIIPIRWRTIAAAMNRPYPVTPSMILLVALVPLYILIPHFHDVRSAVRPQLPIDHVIPQQPVWVLIYGALYLWLILLPVFVVSGTDHIRRTVRAYLMVWLASYAVFIAVPTVAPRASDAVAGNGFAVWGLQQLYAMDTPYNCFPSLHVAHSVVSAFSVWPLHRGLGLTAFVAAALVAISTLFTKQHYVLDIAGGALLAWFAYLIFLRPLRRASTREMDSALAPYVAAAITPLVAAMMTAYWVMYRLGVEF